MKFQPKFLNMVHIFLLLCGGLSVGCDNFIHNFVGSITPPNELTSPSLIPVENSNDLKLNLADSSFFFPSETLRLVASGGTPPYFIGKESGPGILNSSGILILSSGTTDVTKVYVEDATGKRKTASIKNFYPTLRLCTDSISYEKRSYLTDSGGILGSYSNYEYCTFEINGPVGAQITFHFENFDLENGVDYLKIYDGNYNTQIASLTGTATPADVIANSGKMLLEFSSNGSNTATGFYGRWFITPPAISLSSSSTSYAPGTPFYVNSIGGTPPYIFSISSGSASVTPSGSNSYRAEVSPDASVQDVTISVQDAYGSSANLVVALKPTIGFLNSSQTVAENAGSTTATIAIATPLNTDISVQYAITGTASSPSDFNFPISGTITIPAGQTTYSFSIPIVNDSTFESDETIIITINPDSSYDIGSNSALTIRILDDDFSSPYHLDPTFNTLGYRTIGGTYTSEVDYMFGLGIDSTNRIVATGMLFNSGTSRDMAVWRFTSTGAMDSTFASSGQLLYNYWVYDWGKDLIVLPDDRIVIGGYVDNSSDDPTAWRINTNGTYDTSFNSTGMNRFAYAAGTDVQGNGIARTSDGGYVMVGGKSFDWMVVAKFTSAGAIDTTFGTSGKTTINAILSYGFKIAVDSVGRIVVVGSTRPGGASDDYDMTVWRFTSAGALDTTFNGTGSFSHDGAAGVPNSNDEGYDLYIDASNNIYVTGYSAKATNRQMAIWKISGATGTLDTSFNSTGYATTGEVMWGDGDDIGQAIAYDATTGKILVSGYGTNQYNVNVMTVWRYSTLGVLDTTFSTTGYITHSIGGRKSMSHALIVDSTGKIIVGGRAATSSTGEDAAIWRFSQ